VVGVNEYRLADEEELEIHRPDPAIERKQAGRLSGTRTKRDSGAVEQALGALKQAASTEGENLMPYFLDAARARASEGEMVAALQEVFGSYTEQPVF
jgi:methylmalonyl-CoA mutase N-terminal domain/subunit